MVLTIKFIGALRRISDKTQLTINYEEGMSLKQLMAKILQEVPPLERTLSIQQLDDSRFNALILVNGREISVLNGLETELNDGDEIVFVPVVHGG
jgi:molybdopterin synthase sulfur carrier subunit